MTFDDIKTHKKPLLYSFSEKYIFRKTAGAEGQIDHPVFLGLTFLHPL